MKNNFFNSFRFEIVLYSLLSMLYTIITEAAIFLGLYVIRIFVNDMTVEENASSNMLQNNLRSNVTSDTFAAKSTIADPNSVLQTQLLHNGYICLLIGIFVVIGIMLFIFYFLFLTRKISNYLGEILMGINALSNGDFYSRIEIKKEDEFAMIAIQLNKMSDDLRLLMENERKNEHTKNDLITSVAHDLRTPLTSIIGYLELARNQKSLSEQEKDKYLSIAYDKSKRLEKLIEDLFNYTKFSSGEVALSVSEIDIVKLMEQMVDEFYPSFQENGLEYDFNTSGGSMVVMADGDLLARAFANLIGNAVKYGKDGKSIRIKVIRSSNTVSVSIINYGEVIPEKDIESIFDRFFRVENSRSRETGGTGLGLAIAKSIILMHDGTLKATSDLEGTIFEVVLKLKTEVEQVSEVTK